MPLTIPALGGFFGVFPLGLLRFYVARRYTAVMAAPVDVFFRNPFLYIRELVELRVNRIIWDRGLLVTRSVDPYRHAELYYPPSMDFEVLVSAEQGVSELRRGHTMANPWAVYPTWIPGGETPEALLRLIEEPVGDNPLKYQDYDLSVDARPIRGQPHKIFILYPPSASTLEGRQVYRFLADVQEEHPEVTLHIHGLYGYATMFGGNFKSVDTDARITAAHKKVMLPNGREVDIPTAAKTWHWLSLIGYNARQLAVPRNRCLYNIKSALWAAEHFKENLRFKSTGFAEVDPESVDAVTPTTRNVYNSRIKPGSGDKLACDVCSLQNTCKYFRVGAVCSIPGSDPAPLARFFASRDADKIIDGLGTLLAAQSRRVERGVKMENETGEFDPEVTKMMDGLFRNGEKLAKLLRPSLAGPKVGVAVQVQSGQTHASMGVAAAVAELEARGYDRDSITAEMIEKVMLPRPELDAIDTVTVDAEIVDEDED